MCKAVHRVVWQITCAPVGNGSGRVNKSRPRLKKRGAIRNHTGSFDGMRGFPGFRRGFAHHPEQRPAVGRGSIRNSDSRTGDLECGQSNPAGADESSGSLESQRHPPSTISLRGCSNWPVIVRRQRQRVDPPGLHNFDFLFELGCPLLSGQLHSQPKEVSTEGIHCQGHG